MNETQELPASAGLAVRLGRGRVAMPVGEVIGVIDIRIAPLPLAPPRIAGFGYHEGRVVTCIGFGPVATERQKAVLLRPDWALAVDDVLGFVTVTVAPRAGDRLPRWLAPARAHDGRAVGWIDVAALLDDLA